MKTLKGILVALSLAYSAQVLAGGCPPGSRCLPPEGNPTVSSDLNDSKLFKAVGAVCSDSKTKFSVSVADNSLWLDSGEEVRIYPLTRLFMDADGTRESIQSRFPSGEFFFIDLKLENGNYVLKILLNGVPQETLSSDQCK